MATDMKFAIVRDNNGKEHRVGAKSFSKGYGAQLAKPQAGLCLAHIASPVKVQPVANQDVAIVMNGRIQPIIDLVHDDGHIYAHLYPKGYAYDVLPIYDYEMAYMPDVLYGALIPA